MFVQKLKVMDKEFFDKLLKIVKYFLIFLAVVFSLNLLIPFCLILIHEL